MSLTKSAGAVVLAHGVESLVIDSDRAGGKYLCLSRVGYVFRIYYSALTDVGAITRSAISLDANKPTPDSDRPSSPVGISRRWL